MKRKKVKREVKGRRKLLKTNELERVMGKRNGGGEGKRVWVEY